MNYIPESPKNDSFNELNEEDALQIIFPPNLERMNELFEKNLDYLYCINAKNSKYLSSTNINNENNTVKKETKDINLVLDDYEMYYKIFADLDENEYSQSNKDDNIPFYLLNLEYEKEIIFSYVEDEKIVKIEKSIEKQKDIKIPIINKKIFEITKKRRKKLNKNKSIDKIKKTEINIHDKFFPFRMGRGLINNSVPNCESSSLNIEIHLNPSSFSCESLDFNRNDFSTHPKENSGKNEKIKIRNFKKKIKEIKDKKSIDEINYDNEKIKTISNEFIYKFKIKRYFIDENGRRKKIKKKRKYKPDDIRKKIKCRFHKTLKNIINNNLKKAGSKLLFDFFPQCFVENVSKKLNSKCLDLTYEELISTNFANELNNKDYPKSKIYLKKYKKNLKVLNYLENNPDIRKKSGFDIIKDRKYKDILSLYFKSFEFENELMKLKNEKENPEYIQDYIYYAKNFINYCSRNEIERNNENIEEEENNEDVKFDI